MIGLLSDVTFAFRQLRRAPGFAILAVLAIGIGIGATTTVFSIVHAVLLEPLPYPNADRLVRVRETSPQDKTFSVSEANFLDFRGRSSCFDALAAVRRTSATLLGEGAKASPDVGNSVGTAPDAPVRVAVVETTAALFPALGVNPGLGRSLLESDELPNSTADVAVLSYGLWQQHFQGDPKIVGRTLRFDGGTRVVIGVMPQGMNFPFGAELWVPLGPDPAYPRGDHRVEVFGSLAPGVSLAAARAELTSIAARLADEYPATNAGWGVQLVTFRDWLIGPRVARVNLVLVGAVALLLLLACANVSNLLLARATLRQREIGLRTALGAGRGRLVRQMLTESVVLGFLGGAAGLALASSTVGVLGRVGFQALPRLNDVRVDGLAMAVALALSLLATVAFSLVPALHASSGVLAGTTRQGRWGTTDRTRRARESLVVLEIGLGMVLVVGSVLLLRSFLHLRAADPGFTPDRVLAVDVALPEVRYGELAPETAAFFRDVLERIEALPGVAAAGATMVEPFSGLRPTNFFAAADRPVTPEAVVQAQWRCVTPGYFRAVGVPLVAGRWFDATDRVELSPFADGGQGRLKVVVSESIARLAWDDTDVVGRELLWGGVAGGMPLEVVGVVGDIQDVALAAPRQGVVFVSEDQVPWPQMTIMVRAADDPAQIAGSVRRVIREVDPRLALSDMRPLTDSFDAAVAGPRFSTVIVGVFAGAALLLALIGIYGVTAISVAHRTGEIAVRMVVGALPEAILGMVVGRALVLAGWGIGLGTLIALASSRLLASVLYGVPATDATSYGAVALLLAGATVLASLVPAIRAFKVDPAQIVRAE